MKLRDRVSGSVVDRLPDPVLLGQWLLESGDRGGPACLNGCPVEHGDALVPDPMGRWTIVVSDGTLGVTGRFFPDALAGEQDIEALLQIGDLLGDPAKVEAGWLG